MRLYINWTSFKQRYCSWMGLVLMALLLAGCAANQARDADDPSVQPLQRLQVPLVSADDEVMAQIMAAEFALQAGDMDAAAQAYARAAARSTDPRVLERAAGMMLSTGNRAAAEQLIVRMQALGAADSLLARLRAQMALAHGHRQQAGIELKKVLIPDDREAWGAFAQLLSSARDPALSGVLLDRLVTADTLPENDEAVWVAMSQLGEKLGRHAFAQRIAVAAADRFGSAQTYAWAAHLSFVNADVEAGKAFYAKAVKVAPDKVGVRRTWAAALVKLGDYREAAEVLAAGPQTLATFATRAAYAARADDHDALVRVYAELQTAAAKLDENPSFLLGELADTLGKAEQALAWYSKVPLASKFSFDARARQVVLLDQTGSRSEARSLVHELQQLYADDAEQARRVFHLEAQLYLRAGDPAAAVKVYDRALEQFPNDTSLLYSRALSQADAGHVAAAIADLRRVLALEPNHVNAMNALGYTLADSNQNLAEAKTLISRAMQRKPDEPAIIDSWGWLQYRLGHLDKAEQTLRRAWEMMPDPDIGTHLGEVLWMHGKREQAQAIFDSVRESHPDSMVLRETLERLQP